jgi:hypothetical protein
MDAAIHFACNSLTLVQVTEIRPAVQSRPSYVFAYNVYPPYFTKSRKDKSRQSIQSKRYYLNQRCLQTPWENKKIGPLWIPRYLKVEPVKLQDYLLLDVKHGPKGYYGVSHLPPSWSNPIITFFKLVQQPRKVKYYIQNPVQLEELKQTIYIRVPGGGYITTLMHSLIVLALQDWSFIIDMFRKIDKRYYSQKTFTEIRDHPKLLQAGIDIPTTQNFIMELVLWAQDPELLHRLEKTWKLESVRNPDEFTQEGLQFLQNIPNLKIKVTNILQSLKRQSTIF